MKMNRRILSLTLAFCLLFCSSPCLVFTVNGVGNDGILTVYPNYSGALIYKLGQNDVLLNTTDVTHYEGIKERIQFGTNVCYGNSYILMLQVVSNFRTGDEIEVKYKFTTSAGMRAMDSAMGNAFYIASNAPVNGSQIKGKIVHLEDLANTEYPSEYTEYTYTFVVPEMLSGTKSSYFVWQFFIGEYGGGNVYMKEFTAENKTLIKENEEASIWDNILNLISGLYHGLVGGEDRRGFVHTSLWENIGNVIKIGITDLFVPPDGFIDDMKEEISEAGENNLGAVWQSGGVFISFLDSIRNIDVNAEPEIRFPEIKAPIFTEPITWRVLYAGKTYSLAWAMENDEENFFYEAYIAYQAIMTLLLVTAFVEWAMGKYDEIIGG